MLKLSYSIKFIKTDTGSVSLILVSLQRLGQFLDHFRPSFILLKGAIVSFLIRYMLLQLITLQKRLSCAVLDNEGLEHTPIR